MSTLQEEETLWREYRNHLVRFVRNRVESEATAEDIVHDVLTRAYEKRNTLRSGQKFEPWIYQITRNAIIDHYRSRKALGAMPNDLAAAEGFDGGNARRELAACLRPLIRTLPERYRDAVDLSEIEGLTQKETAERLGLSLSGAKSRVQRARRMLEAKLLECCRVEFDSRGAIVDYESRTGCDSEGTLATGPCGGC